MGQNLSIRAQADGSVEIPLGASNQQRLNRQLGA
jgi:hypothetical protein